MSLYKLLVCGGRDYKNLTKVFEVLNGYFDVHGDNLLVIQGWEPNGADSLAMQWCRQREVDCLSVPARWTRLNTKGAGPIRNKRMRDLYRPHEGVAFPTGGPGTKGMIALLKELGIPVNIIGEFT